MPGTSKSKIVELNVLKRGGSIQPFDKNKLVTSMSKAGATQKQASLVSDRIVNRLAGRKQPVPTSQLSTMVARSLGQVNPVASSKYTAFRDQELRSSVAPAAKGAVFAVSKLTAGAKPSLTQTSPQKIAQAAAAAKPATPLKVAVPLTGKSPATPAGITQAPAGVTADATAQLRKKPALVRLGVAPRTNISQQQILEKTKKQPEYAGISRVSSSPMKLSPEGAHAPKQQPDLQIYTSDDAIHRGNTCTITALLVIVIDDGYGGTLNVLDKSGIVTCKNNYFSPTGTWPEESEQHEVMEHGQCSTLYQLWELGVYEFTVTWPGDEETLPATSSTVSIQVTEAPTRTCWWCRSIIDAAMEFCPKCGAWKRRVCKACGFQFDSGDIAYCPNCGAYVGRYGPA